MPLNQWKADPEKYMRLAEPFADRAEALRATEAFIDELSKLREKYHIPELVCQLEVYIKTETPEGEGVEGMTGGAGWGNQMQQAHLARKMADREMNNLLVMIKNLADHSKVLASTLITDPRAEKEIDDEDTATPKS